jgi:cbb3-type cytochrome oxidase maturation protein
MNVLVYLLPIALSLGLMGLIAFLWSLRSGQYEDLEGAALRILDDDDLRDDEPDRPRNPARRDDR